jgi:hypothetical protein
MKSVAVFLLVAVFTAGIIAAMARTVTNPPGNANQQSVNAVAGPPPVRQVASDKSSVQPSKKTLKKSKITLPPPLHDPN